MWSRLRSVCCKCENLIWKFERLAAPESPTNIKVDGTCGQTNVTLTWTPGKSYGAPLVVYNIEYTASNDLQKWYFLKSTRETLLLIDVKNDLPPSSKLDFRVITMAYFQGKKYESAPSGTSPPGNCTTLAGGDNLIFVNTMWLSHIVQWNKI